MYRARPEPAPARDRLAVLRDRRAARRPSRLARGRRPERPDARGSGLAWLAVGLAGYAVYRRRFVHAPLTQTVRAPQIVLWAVRSTIEYRTIVVPVVRSAETEEALVAAARLAAERGATIALVHVLEVPMRSSSHTELPAEEAEADELLDGAQAIVESYGVRAVVRLAKARRAGLRSSPRRRAGTPS